MRTVTKRSLLSVALVASIVVGLVPAGAQVPAPTHKASVDVRNVLAGITRQEFKITINRTAGTPADTSANAVMLYTPAELTLQEGRGPSGWTAFNLSGGRVLFTGGTLANGNNVFSIFANTPKPQEDLLGLFWLAQVSTDGGDKFSYVQADPAIPNALETNVRVLQVTALNLLKPAGASDNTNVTGAQTNVDAVCAIQNVGSGDLTVDGILSVGSGTATKAGTNNPAAIGPGQTVSFPFDLSFNDVTQTTASSLSCSGDAPNKANTSAFGKSLGITIQPRVIFSYVSGSVSPKLAAPSGTPSFFVRVDKKQFGTVPSGQSDGSPAITLDQSATSFNLVCTNQTTTLASPTTIAAGKQDGFSLNFGALTIPLLTADQDCNFKVNIDGTDANGAPLSASGHRPLSNTNDVIRIDAAIPVIGNLSLTGPLSRCCNEPSAVKDGDKLDGSGTAQDKNSAGTMENCSSCTIIYSKLVEYSDKNGSTEIKRTDVSASNTAGALAFTSTGVYEKTPVMTQSVRWAVIVQDGAGNKSNGGEPTLSLPFLVDNIAPTIVSATATPAPSAADQDLQRTVMVRFNEPVDNFDRPADGTCPPMDWRTDDNTIVSCRRDQNFLGAGLLTAKDFADDTGGLSLVYLPQSPLTFRDRVGNPLPSNLSVPILDRIPPKAPLINTVAGKTADSADGKFYTNQSNASYVLSGARAVVPDYLVQVWHETNGQSGLQTEGTPATPESPAVAADTKLGQSTVQAGQSTVTVTPTTNLPTSTAQAGVQHIVYGRSVDPAGNPTAVNLIKQASVILDTVSPALASASATVNGIEVNFQEAVTGRNSQPSWLVISTRGQTLGVGSVEDDATDKGKRLLKMSDPRWWTASGMPGTVRYEFFGAETDRYRDKAGNTVLNSPAVSVTTTA